MKKIIYIMLAAIVFSALAFGGCENQDQGQDQGQSQGFEQMKSRMPAKCMTKEELAYEKAIRNRLQTGFNNWNQGYEAWLKWCDELYDDNAHYNVYGQRLTLQQYKDMMGQLFQKQEIRLGDLDNVLVEGDWAAIRYTVFVKDKATGAETELKTMEFVNFRKDDAFGAKVMEGWAISDSQLSAH